MMVSPLPSSVCVCVCVCVFYVCFSSPLVRWLFYLMSSFLASRLGSSPLVYRVRLPACLSLCVSLPLFVGYLYPCLTLFIYLSVSLTCSQVSLASRFDSYGKDPSGEVGRQWRGEVEEKIEKWQELQTAKTKKALPKPDEKPATKRGGKRQRKFKEKFAMTDVRKEANRMGFASMADEYSDTAMGLDFGMLGKGGTDGGGR